MGHGDPVSSLLTAMLIRRFSFTLVSRIFTWPTLSPLYKSTCDINSIFEECSSSDICHAGTWATPIPLWNTVYSMYPLISFCAPFGSTCTEIESYQLSHLGHLVPQLACSWDSHSTLLQAFTPLTHLPHCYQACFFSQEYIAVRRNWQDLCTPPFRVRSVGFLGMVVEGRKDTKICFAF